MSIMVKKIYYALCKREVVRRARLINAHKQVQKKEKYDPKKDPGVIACRSYQVSNSLNSSSVNFARLYETWKNYPTLRAKFDYTKTQNPLLQSFFVDLQRGQCPNCEEYQKKFDLTVALIKSFIENNPEEFDQLLKQGANPNDIGPYTETVYDPEISYQKTDFVSVNQLLETEDKRVKLFKKLLSKDK